MGCFHGRGLGTFWIADSGLVEEIKAACSSHFLETDYLGLNRVLAIWKSLEWVRAAQPPMHDLLAGFWVAFVCKKYRTKWKQWEKIDRCYEFARRLAYLNLDSVYCNLLAVSPAAQMIRRMAREDVSGAGALEELKNVLAAYERAVFNTLYHSHAARTVVAFVANRVHRKLRGLGGEGASRLILHWLKVNLPALGDSDHLTGDEKGFSLTARFRSFFVPNPSSVVAWEHDLAKKVRPAAATSILLFPAWDVGMTHIEPDEVFVDVLGNEAPDTRLVGRLISWLADRLDKPHASPNDPYWMEVKRDLADAYRDLLAQAVAALFPTLELRLWPWPLGEIGLWEEEGFGEKALVWFVRGKRLTPILKYMGGAEKPGKFALPCWYELKGVLDLVEKIQQGVLADTAGAASRMLVLTCSVGLRYKDRTGQPRDLLEFDGGVVTIEGRTGRLVFYGLETRSSQTAEACRNRLEDKLQELVKRTDPRYRALIGVVGSINSHSAYIEISLDSRRLTT